MNGKTILKVAGGILVASQCISVGAQPGDTSGAASGTSSAASTAKSIKQANRQLAKRVRAALSKTSGLDTTTIAIRASSGVVTLTGSVPGPAQIDKASEVASGVPGVTSVKNALTVREVGQ